MKVLIVIVKRPDETLRVGVAPRTLKGIGVWVKNFKSKKSCLIELKTLGLLTALDLERATKSEFEKKRTAILRFRGVAEPQALLAAEFVYS